MSRCGTTREETTKTKRCLSIYLGSAQDVISERRTSSRAKFVMCLVATAWSECNVIPAGAPPSSRSC